jgi:hypothetical protein
MLLILRELRVLSRKRPLSKEHLRRLSFLRPQIVEKLDRIKSSGLVHSDHTELDGS